MRAPSFLWLSMAAATPLLPVSAENSADREIIVTATPLSETDKALKDCLAAQCPPDADIRASLAHAENQFVAGEYRDAKSTLKKAIGRNARHKNGFPVEMSDLYRASGRVAEHLGEADEYRLRLLDMRDTLKSNFAADDAKVLAAQVEVADSRVKLGYPDHALAIYGEVEKSALAAGQNRLATLAQIRTHLLTYALGEQKAYKPEMRRARDGLATMVARPLPGADDFTLVAEIALARMDRKEGRADTTAAIMKRLVERGADRPLLLSAEPVKVAQNPYGARTNEGQYAPRNYFQLPTPQNVLTQLPRNFEDRWMDVGFWVGPDGRVNDIEILRAEGSGDWTKSVTDSIGTRIYAPIRSKNGETHPGFYLVERYTYTARYMQDITGSRIPRRSAQARIERIDLTPENFDQPFTNATKSKIKSES